ncbi:MAG: 4Fe-4S dicluster domain-containing protein [Desulfobacteraceae bacterium]|nr:4Fe-4S dicluster domain-containing protein [Desulfobacteraceae bacterium]
MLAIHEITAEGKKSRRTKPVVDPNKCKGCFICVAFCPEQILVPGEVLNQHGFTVVKVVEGKTCRGCRRCYVMCPDLAFTFIGGESGHAADDEG